MQGSGRWLVVVMALVVLSVASCRTTGGAGGDQDRVRGGVSIGLPW